MTETTPQPAAKNVRANDNDGVLTAAHFVLEKFCKQALESNTRGPAELTKLATSFGINRSYRTLINALNKYKSSGLASLKRKEYSGKGESRSFSESALIILQRHYVSSLVMKNAYEDMHKELRSAAVSFIDISTGEEFIIKNGLLHEHPAELQGLTLPSSYSTKFIEGIYRLPGYDPSRIDNNSFELRVGSYKSACRYLGTLDVNEPALFYGRYGIHDYRNKRQHTMKLNYSHLLPGEYIVGDGKQLDVIVISEDWRRVYRPWLMGWYDMATRRYCYELAVHEDSTSIANSLSVAIQQWGVPQSVKTDNGSSYKSGRFQEMCRFFNIEQKFATVKLARAKPIESMHNIIDNLLKSAVGYTGNKYVEMPLDTRERIKLAIGAQRDAKKYAKAVKENTGFSFNIADPDARLKRSKRRLMHISELKELLESKFDEYHERIHGGLKEDKLGRQAYNINCKDESVNELGEKINCPNGRYLYHVKQGFKPVAAEPGIVALYASNFELRTVQLKTGINLANGEYWHSKLSGIAAQRVVIRYSSVGSRHIYVFHSEELQKVRERSQLDKDIMDSLKFICIAKLQTIIDYNDEPAYKDELILQRTEEKAIRDALQNNVLLNVSGVINPPQSNIIQLTGSETDVQEIKQAESEIIEESKPKKNKYKDVDLF